MYKHIIRPFLFLFDPEEIHHFVFRFLKLAFKIPFVHAVTKRLFSYPSKPVSLFGITFPNRVGLAAGFDKDAKLTDELSAFGFGFIEIGTVTPKPQSGNPKPRMFRLPADQGLINRMGFNNEGFEAASQRLKKRKSKVIIGGNIGKNKLTENDLAFSDYAACFEGLYSQVDYFVVNVSSPNTPGLRELQEKEPLARLLNQLMDLNKKKPKQKPILLKIAPDLTYSQLDDIISIVIDSGIAGLIIGNTTISRSGLKTNAAELSAIGSGGLSGKPLGVAATEVIRYASQKSKKAFPIIGVGGIHSPEDALKKIEAGADLIQIYTGFIYEGPGLIKKINKLVDEAGY